VCARACAQLLEVRLDVQLFVLLTFSSYFVLLLLLLLLLKD